MCGGGKADWENVSQKGRVQYGNVEKIAGVVGAGLVVGQSLSLIVWVCARVLYV